MLRVDPDIEPELPRMIHPWNMLTLSKPDRFLDVLADTGVSFEMELRPVEALIFKPPLFWCPVVIRKDRAEDAGQLPVVISLEFADLLWECPLSRHISQNGRTSDQTFVVICECYYSVRQSY